MSSLYRKTGMGLFEKLKGCLAKWKWLAPNMSYKGRILIINNVVASSLWHKLACIDPPPKLLAEFQALLVDFFGGGIKYTGSLRVFLFLAGRGW